jgi:hypothetical protein
MADATFHKIATSANIGENEVEQETWIMDSGATSHMTPHAHLFHDIKRPNTSRLVMTGAKELLQVSGIGVIRARTNTGKPVVLNNVLLVPKLAASLMSLAKLLQAGKKVEGEGSTVRICDDQYTYLNFYQQGNLFQTKLTITHNSEQALSFSYNVQEKHGESTLTWHKRLGHMSHRYMKHMVHHKLAHGVPLSNVQDFTCEDCHRGKMMQKPYPKEAERLQLQRN